jgi:long-chain acyl-CoA synthetase
MISGKAKQQTSTYAGKPWLRHYDYWVPEQTNFPRQPIYQMLNLAAVQFSERPATVFLHARLSFGELKERADKLATALSRLFGIGKGDRVGIMLPNCPQYLVSFFAIVRLGAIVTNVNPIYTPREVELVAKDSGMRAMITLDALAETVLGVQAQTQIEHIITTGIGEYSTGGQATPTPADTLSFSEMIASINAPEIPRVEIDAEEDVAALVYTGGTTGVPKGAMLTHYNLYAAAIQCTLWGGPFLRRGEDRFLMVIPYFHVYGLVVGVLFGVWQGAMQIPIARFDANLLLKAIKDYQPTYFPGVPTLFVSMLNHPEAKTSGLDRVQRFNSGSAPLPIEVIEQFERLSGAMLFEGYGMTETAAVATSTPTLAKRKPGSIGLPMTATECKIVDLEDGEREVPLGEEGELCIRGPQVMKGYWNKPEETADAIRAGWLYTGDVARMDEDGYFYIVQRKKDMILVSGFNVYPNEVEDVMFTHEAVKEAAVIGISDPYRGEAVKAFVVLREDTPAASTELALELIAYCRSRLAKYKVPSTIEFVESLPKSAVGKVLRRELKAAEEAKQP